MKTVDRTPSPALHDRIQECMAFAEKAGWKVAAAFTDGPGGLKALDRKLLARAARE